MDRQCNTNMTKKKKHPQTFSVVWLFSRLLCIYSAEQHDISSLSSHYKFPHTNNHPGSFVPYQAILFFCVCVPKKKQQRCCAVGARKSRQCSECVECSSPGFVGWFCSCHSHLGERINILGWSGTTLMYISAKKKKSRLFVLFPVTSQIY